MDLRYGESMWTEEFVRFLEESTTEKSLIDEAMALKESNLPAKIYKYRSDSTSYARDNLKTDTVWMASPESYNDPYDSVLTFPLDTLHTILEASLVEKLVVATNLSGLISPLAMEDSKKSSKPFKTVIEHIRAVKPASAAQFWDERAKAYSEQLRSSAEDALSKVQSFRKLEKVCSFSAVNDSLLMWSHYAENHRGFCVEYDILGLNEQHFFRKNLYPVLYTKEFYNLRPFMLRLSGGPRGDFRPMVPLVAMLHKFDGWSYEFEWRLMKETESELDDHNRSAPKASRVFLGARFDPSAGSDLLAICRQKAIPIFQMHLAEGKFALSPREFVP